MKDQIESQMEQGMLAEDFLTPPLRYRMNTIVHTWPENYPVMADAIKAYGYGGVATNPPYTDGYTGNTENIRKFTEILAAVKERNLTYWIYDEKGYPSGLGGGQSLGEPVHNEKEEEARLFASRRKELQYPELEAKGFYMVRRIAYEDKHSRFYLDDESDRIIWAAKYPMEVSVLNTSRILYEEMKPVPFSDTFCECDLKAGEALFIFCAKPAYEGAHLTHNVSSRSRYINILDPCAVKRFLETGYEPIAEAAEKAYAGAEAVFTDEPSLQTPYMHGDEVWPYALAPWVDGLFERFEERYGYSLMPYLPQIFEGRQVSYKTRVDFYNLIGELIASSYVAQIRDWCHAHGTKFSGHYLAEEYVTFHVLYYGSYLRVLRETDFQGVDVLAAHPGVYHYNTTRFAQMAARKNNRNGIMTELCPFMDMEVFRKNPVKNAIGIINLLYLGGCRKINSYFSSDFSRYDPLALEDYTGFMSPDEARQVNAYAGRLGVMLEGAVSACRTAVYYPLEDVQAKTRPWHCARESADCETDRSLIELCKRIYEDGEDYILVDHEDIAAIARGTEKEDPLAEIENIIIPTMDVIHSDAYDGLVRLKSMGKQIFFHKRVPLLRADKTYSFKPYDFREESLGLNDITDDGVFQAEKDDIDILHAPFMGLSVCGRNPVTGEDVPLVQGRFRKDGKPLLFVVNNTLTDAEMTVRVSDSLSDSCRIELWDPQDGSVKPVCEQKEIVLNSYKGVFVYLRDYSGVAFGQTSK